MELAIHIINGDFNTTLGVFTQGAIRAGENTPVGNMDRVTWTDLHTTKRVGGGVVMYEAIKTMKIAAS